MAALDSFHPLVQTWFERRFPEGPTEPQEAGWPAIARGEHTLIAAPTGSGKTLSAFLVCIDQLIRRAEVEGSLPEATQVVYVSPLKALASDIQVNLETPLRELRELAAEAGTPLPEVRAWVRTGDTPASARARMLKHPPHLLITTPESLYLMLTAERSREMLREVGTLIIDEIHAVARDKRGSHLAVTVERLAALCDEPPVRIGLSATQRPIETVSRLLVGAGAPGGSAPECTIVDHGHRRALDLGLEVPPSELGAVASHEQLGEILDRIASLVLEHQTTLVFVNTRRLAERAAHLLGERLGEEVVAAHHGSLSKDRRTLLEGQLREGKLRALVATASLELGIDVGPVELACQIGSPRSLATFLQRVGRSGHTRTATPKGRLFPTTRDELVESAAVLRGVRAGHLDRLCPPVAPLDILAQQIVAACAAEDWEEDALYALMRRSAPFAELPRADFDEIVELLAEGVQTGRGRRGAYLHRDRVHGMLRARRGARLSALTSGGAIPETADYRVVADPDETFVGTVNEDFAVESMRGDIFLLGSTSWRIRRVENGVVRVEDAKGAPPTIPFWLGEAPARTEELSSEVSELRTKLAGLLAAGGVAAATRWLVEEAQLGEDAAEQIARYLDAASTALGVVPTQRDVVFERFFDETGGMQLVVHAPYGGRINRGFGLALRKRFCKTFDFELQAAANDDAIVLSLGPQHSFPLEQVPHFLSSASVDEALTRAMLLSPMFTVRWRWNLGRALLVLRRRGGRKNPAPIQRMEADDLMAAIFPGLAQCQENATGPIEIPDHPIVRQTLHDCLHEAADLPGLVKLLENIESGEVRAHFRDTTEPSVLSHEIINGRPFTFLDDAPLEERRTRAVALRRGLPENARDLGRLDSEAIAGVREEAAPEPRDAEELHDLLLATGVQRPRSDWEPLFESLVSADRAACAKTQSGPLWFAAERRPWIDLVHPGVEHEPSVAAPPGAPVPEDADAAATEMVRGHLEGMGPAGIEVLASATGLSESRLELAVARLEAEGFAIRGRFDESPDAPAEQVCARRLLARIHRRTQDRLRREIEPVSAQDYLRFLLRWQYAVPDARREGRRGLLAVIEQLQGFEVAAGSWESEVLPARVAGYRATWLDELCLSGEATWARLTPRVELAEPGAPPGRGGLSPSRATRVGFTLRADLSWLLAAARGENEPARPGPGAAADLLELLADHGASFHSELLSAAGRLPVEVEEGLWDLVARGLVHADGFQAVRALLAGRARARSDRRVQPRGLRRRSLRRAGRAHAGAEGRWALLPEAGRPERDELAEAVAEQLLARWGVVFRDVLTRESLVLPWREILWALRRLEARGTIRGGRFVTGFVGEQYALPGAVEALRRVRRIERTGEIVELSAVDPLNLAGILTPGPRIPAVPTRRVRFVDGLPEEATLRTRSSERA